MSGAGSQTPSHLTLEPSRWRIPAEVVKCYATVTEAPKGLLATASDPRLASMSKLTDEELATMIAWFAETKFCGHCNRRVPKAEVKRKHRHPAVRTEG